KAMTDTYENTCKELAGTVSAWKTVLGVDMAGFNTLLTRNNLTPLKLTPTALTAPASCTFVAPAAPVNQSPAVRKAAAPRGPERREGAERDKKRGGGAPRN